MSLIENGADPATARRSASRVVIYGITAIVAILGVAAILLFVSLPTGSAFTERVDDIFVNYNLTSLNSEATGEITIAEQAATIGKLLGILADSGAAFSDVLVSYRVVIFVLMIFATGLLIASLVFLVTIIALNRRIGEIQRAGIQVSSLVISRDERKVYLNDMEFALTPAAIETIAVLAEARMDEDVLTGAEIESMISGKNAADCDEASGATRIKRLRDALGNQMVSELLVKNIARKGYMLSIDKDVIRMI